MGFVARPIGGVVFGHFGDRIERKSMLVLTLTIMGTATVLIGLLPNYAQIGSCSSCACCKAWASAASGAAPC